MACRPIRLRRKTLHSLQRSFFKTVGIASVGALGAQAVSMIFVPILSRLYGPEAWGVLGTVVAIIALVAPVAALSYPIAIVLPKQDREAIALVKISIASATAVALIALATVLSLWGVSTLTTFSLPVSPALLLVIPFAIFFLTSAEIATQWLIREDRFEVLAKAQIGTSLLANGLRAAMGLISPTIPFLVGAYGVGTAIQGAVLAVSAGKTMRAKWSSHSMREIVVVARRNIDFVIYRTPQILINSLSQGLPTIILATWYGTAAAGFFAMSTSILAIPTLLLGKAVSDVFYPLVAKSHQTGHKVGPMLIATTGLLALAGLFPFGLVIVWGPDIFGYVLGEQWFTAGQYAQWLSLWLFMGLINRASVAAIPVLKLQRCYLLFEIVSVLSRVGVLASGVAMQIDDLALIAAFSVTSATLNVVLIVATLAVGRKIDRQRRSWAP
jgi:O-antigen/teichoic acid export membrane protein